MRSGRGVRRPLRAVVAVEAELTAPQLADGEEVALVALVVVRPELDVRAGAAVGGGHPPDALHALLDVPGRGDVGVADALDRDPRSVVRQRHHHVARGPAEAL